MRRVRVYWWRKKKSPHGNFGDEITIPILSRLFGIEGIAADLEHAELLGAGSILEFYAWGNARPRMPRRWLRRGDLHIWGTGTLFSEHVIDWPQRLHLHAVRGSLTAQRLGAWSIPLGDPGILVSRLIDRPKKKIGVAAMPHFVDKKPLQLPKHWHVIDPEQPLDEVLTQLASAELVVSSSLHGLIAADSFNIPCIWVSFHGDSPDLQGSATHKFRDYASARGCDFNEPIRWPDAMAMSVDTLGQIATVAGRDVEAWQSELISAFPFA